VDLIRETEWKGSITAMISPQRESAKSEPSAKSRITRSQTPSPRKPGVRFSSRHSKELLSNVMPVLLLFLHPDLTNVEVFATKPESLRLVGQNVVPHPCLERESSWE